MSTKKPGPLSDLVTPGHLASPTGQERKGKNDPPNPPQAGGAKARAAADRARKGSRRRRDVAALAAEQAKPVPDDVVETVEARRAWAAAVELMRQSLPPSAFQHWVEPLELRGVHDDCLAIAGPARSRGWFIRRYGVYVGDFVRKISEYRGVKFFEAAPAESDDVL